MLYFIQSNDALKIGYTSKDDVDQRLKQYRTHNPHVRLLKTIPGDTKLEKRFHNILEDYRYIQDDGSRSKEWFYIEHARRILNI